MTPQQKKLLNYIEGYLAETQGIPPSYEEMRCAMDLHSKSGIHRLILALEDRGYIDRLPGRKRSIIIKKPTDGQQCIWDFLERKGLTSEFSDFLLARCASLEA